MGSDFDSSTDTNRSQNLCEQVALARMKAMREAGATCRTITTEFGRDPKSVQRILERAKA